MSADEKVITRTFLEHCSDFLGYNGAFGEINIQYDEWGIPSVQKRSLMSNKDQLLDQAKELTLSKEYAIMKYVSASSVAPQLLSCPKKMTRIPGYEGVVPIIEEIHMEFVGPTLHTCTLLGFHIEPETLLTQLLTACSYIHHLKVLHLDLKPDNVTLQLETGQIKLIDFGFAEITAFRDMEVEAGIRKWKSSPGLLSYLHFGQVDKFGALASCVEDGLPYFQSNFYHVRPGTTRLKHWVNVPGYRDPAAMCCEWLGVGRGLVVDDRTDIFAVGMIVLTHLQACELLTSKDREDDISSLLPKFLKSISHVRGCCTRLEAWQMEHLMRKSAKICDSDLECPRNIAKLAVIKKALLADGERCGLFDQLSSTLGEVVSSLLLDTIHPFPGFRPSASGAVTRLNSQLCHDKSVNHLSCNTTTIHCSPLYHMIVGRIIENGVCILSLTVDMEKKQIMWQFGIRHFRRRPDEEKTQLLHNLVQEMHVKAGCCSSLNHSYYWYRALGRSDILFENYW